MTTRIQGCCMELNNVHNFQYTFFSFRVLWMFFFCVNVIHTSQATKCLKANSTIDRPTEESEWKKATSECVHGKLLYRDRRRNSMPTWSKLKQQAKRMIALERKKHNGWNNKDNKNLRTKFRMTAIDIFISSLIAVDGRSTRLDLLECFYFHSASTCQNHSALLEKPTNARTLTNYGQFIEMNKRRRARVR